jgi:preprotein translocase subunit YajC
VNSFGFLILIVAFAFLWLVLVRPQKRRQVEVKRMLERLEVGDEVLTAGGIYGRVSRIVEDEVTLQIAEGVEVRVARRAIAGVTPEDEAPDDAEADAQDDAEAAPEGEVEQTAAEPPTAENGG